MKENKFFETSLYRESNKKRTDANIENAKYQIRISIMSAWLIGVVGTFTASLIGQIKGNLVLQILLDATLGLACGAGLAILWTTTAKKIETIYRFYMYDIELLTRKIDASRGEEPEEDYEFLGERDE